MSKSKKLVESMKTFSDMISEKSGLDKSKWSMGIQHNVESETTYNNKLWRSKQRFDQLSIVYEDDCFDIEILEYNNTSFELYWFENKGEKCKGMGTEILNHILDVCDEQKINLNLVPVPILARTLKEQISFTKRLIEYYKSFGFNQISKKSPQLIYHFNKNNLK